MIVAQGWRLNCQTRIRGTIAYLCADTKGYHEIAGLMGPGADKFCRSCLISRHDIPQHASSEHLVFRNRQNYYEGLTAAKANKSSSLDPKTGNRQL